MSQFPHQSAYRTSWHAADRARSRQPAQPPSAGRSLSAAAMFVVRASSTRARGPWARESVARVTAGKHDGCGLAGRRRALLVAGRVSVSDRQLEGKATGDPSAARGPLHARQAPAALAGPGRQRAEVLVHSRGRIPAAAQRIRQGLASPAPARSTPRSASASARPASARSAALCAGGALWGGESAGVLGAYPYLAGLRWCCKRLAAPPKAATRQERPRNGGRGQRAAAHLHRRVS